jgi:hypothetical protein
VGLNHTGTSTLWARGNFWFGNATYASGLTVTGPVTGPNSDYIITTGAQINF